ncbi:hypothetical protein DPMN_035169 [Dreissena polymorpha]|uniref:Uncharacterized protein n=1 Tax=Dreissena polymorpha TaxID=45954 RepID=A0A9D4M8Z1_DREPO|nr:hypothetical protein DPMN_035169 [Dreissena polymorpha]
MSGSPSKLRLPSKLRCMESSLEDKIKLIKVSEMFPKPRDICGRKVDYREYRAKKVCVQVSLGKQLFI